MQLIFLTRAVMRNKFLFGVALMMQWYASQHDTFQLSGQCIELIAAFLFLIDTLGDSKTYAVQSFQETPVDSSAVRVPAH